MRSGCATLVALNKWDIGETDLEDATARLAKRAAPAPAGDHLLGAHRAQRAEAARARDRARRSARLAHPDPGAEPVRRRRRRQPAAARQARDGGCASTTRRRSERRPPRFAIQVNDRRLITREWAFHLENRLREAYGLEGVPLVIDFVPHTRRSRRTRPGLATSRGRSGRPRLGASPRPVAELKSRGRPPELARAGHLASTAAAQPASTRRGHGRASPPGGPVRLDRRATAGRAVRGRGRRLRGRTGSRRRASAGICGSSGSACRSTRGGASAWRWARCGAPALWLVAVPALPCQAPGGDACPPADDAIHLVPEDALAYVHLNVDPGTEQYQEAAKVACAAAGAHPAGDRAAAVAAARAAGRPPDFERDIAALVRWRGRAGDRARRRPRGEAVRAARGE